MKLTTILSCLLVFACALSAAASDSGARVGVLGGLNLSSASVTTATTSMTGSYGAGYDFGAFGAYNLASQLDLELDALYAGTSWSGSLGGGSATFTQQQFTLPLTANYWLVKYLSIGAGPYLQMFTGDIGFTSSGGTGSETYAGTKLKTMDIGAIGKLGGKYEVAPRIDVVGDAAFLLGLLNQDDSGVSTNSSKYTQFLFLVGASYRL